MFYDPTVPIVLLPDLGDDHTPDEYIWFRVHLSRNVSVRFQQRTGCDGSSWTRNSTRGTW